jgi:APA family basic amino acid/polyamine antiporter
VYYAMGRDHRVFGILGQWSKTLGTPVAALVAQCVIILALVVAFGSSAGFDTFVYFTGAVFWAFMVLTGMSLFVLREWDRDVERPHKVVGYPVVPLLFVLSSFYMFQSAFAFKPRESMLAAVILLAGLPLYWISRILESGDRTTAPRAE